jgi:hypothetical protein
MERNAKIGIAGVVLVGLGIGLYYQIKKDAALGTGPAKGDLPELKVPEDVDKIDIVNGSKGEVVLEKHGDKWDITKPVNAPANAANLKSLIDNMKDLKIVDRGVAKADDEAKKTYELTPDRGIHVTAMKGADKKLDAVFGKSGGLGDAMMLEGNPDILLVKGYSSWMYGRDLKDWRDREMFKLEDSNIDSFEIDGAHGKFVFTKGGGKDGGTSDWVVIHDKKPIPNLDTEKPKTCLGAFKTLTAEDFGDGKLPPETGLDAPEETVIMRMKDGGQHTLKVGKPVDKAHYAQRDSDPTIYTIGAFPYEWATADVAKFQHASDAGAPDSGVKAPPTKDAGKK